MALRLSSSIFSLMTEEGGYCGSRVREVSILVSAPKSMDWEPYGKLSLDRFVSFRAWVFLTEPDR